jgi:[glutamine synthetase] adenylyltransferase / [glutamine synthetase]-adenylyl-L-tyrosine phosphorylase
VPGAADGISELVERSADPPAVGAALATLREREPDRLEPILADAAAAERLVAVLAASRSLTRLVVADAEALSVVGDPGTRPGLAVDAPPEELIRWKRHELLRIAVRDLAGADDLVATTAALSHLARDVLAASHRLATEDSGGEVRLAVLAMGKLGAAELNYASDIDVMLVGEGEGPVLARAARAVVELAGRCFRVDTNLRPEGRDGPLVRTLTSYEVYWDRWAEPWERQALLKAAPVAGDDALGRRWQAAARQVVWERPFDADDLRQLRAMKSRAEQLLRERGLADREVKRGPGGIRDVEFAAQLLQLVHGRADPELRLPATLDALAALAAGGYVDPDDATVLADAYRFLRRVEHGVQLHDEQQTHTVPDDRSDRRHLARVLGYRGTPDAGPTEAFDRDLAGHRGRVRSIHERVWFRPLLTALAGAGTLSPEAAADRLAAFGFADAERTRQAVVELTRGLTRSSRMMQQVLPLLLDWLSESPDPDLGLLGLRRLASGEQRSTTLAVAFRESPEVARHLAILLGTSRTIADSLVANPDLIERLPDPARLGTKARDALVDSARGAVAWRGEPEERQRALQRWLRRNLVGVAARDVFGHAGVEEVSLDLTGLAEAVLEVVLGSLDPQLPMAVLALGRFGGADLGYASDLDVVFVHEGGAGDHDEAERVAAGLRRIVNGATPAARVWTLDADLRPEGRQGPLSRSLDAWESYLGRWAETWERQAYLRARPVAGDADLGSRLVDRIDEAVHGQPFTDQHAREVRRMKARIERERMPPGEDPEFHLKLGKGTLSDVEFTVQLLQLQHGVRGAATLDALAELEAAGHIGQEDAAALDEAYRFCERTRNRLYLVAGPGDALPTRPEQLRHLARSLGTTGAGLRDEYRRLTRRARRVVERCFYGADDPARG